MLSLDRLWRYGRLWTNEWARHQIYIPNPFVAFIVSEISAFNEILVFKFFKEISSTLLFDLQMTFDLYYEVLCSSESIHLSWVDVY